MDSSMIRIRTLAVSLLMGGMALSFSASGAEGLYSTDEMLGAKVFDSAGESVGRVEDLLMDDGMSLHSLVIKTGSVLGLGGRDVVAERGTFTVTTAESDMAFDDIRYEVHMEMSQGALRELPEYDESWWNQTRDGLSQAWENTKETSKSAWESTKQATESAWHNLREGVKDMGNNTDETTEQ